MPSPRHLVHCSGEAPADQELRLVHMQNMMRLPTKPGALRTTTPTFEALRELERSHDEHLARGHAHDLDQPHRGPG